jgi:hypothetical protein
MPASYARRKPCERQPPRASPQLLLVRRHLASSGRAAQVLHRACGSSGATAQLQAAWRSTETGATRGAGPRAQATAAAQQVQGRALVEASLTRPASAAANAAKFSAAYLLQFSPPSCTSVFSRTCACARAARRRRQARPRAPSAARPSASAAHAPPRRRATGWAGPLARGVAPAACRPAAAWGGVTPRRGRACSPKMVLCPSAYCHSGPRGGSTNSRPCGSCAPAAPPRQRPGRACLRRSHACHGHMRSRPGSCLWHPSRRAQRPGRLPAPLSSHAAGGPSLERLHGQRQLLPAPAILRSSRALSRPPQARGARPAPGAGPARGRARGAGRGAPARRARAPPPARRAWRGPARPARPWRPRPPPPRPAPRPARAAAPSPPALRGTGGHVSDTRGAPEPVPPQAVSSAGNAMGCLHCGNVAALLCPGRVRSRKNFRMAIQDPPHEAATR